MKLRTRKLELGILATVVLAMAALATMPAAGVWLREPVAQRSEPLPLSFPHSKHVKHSSCTHCHHNFKDENLKNTSAGIPCVHCHKSDRPDLVRGIEGEFHDFCKGCHAEKARWLEKRGPVRECAGCHTATADGRMP